MKRIITLTADGPHTKTEITCGTLAEATAEWKDTPEQHDANRQRIAENLIYTALGICADVGSLPFVKFQDQTRKLLAALEGLQAWAMSAETQRALNCTGVMGDYGKVCVNALAAINEAREALTPPEQAQNQSPAQA